MCDKKVIIIGAGLGGLVVGSLLAKEGFKVTIVEKNHHVGGGLQSYRRFGTTFDTGMHIFGGMKPDGNIRKLCEYLGIVDKFKVIDLDDDANIEVHVGKSSESYRLSLNAREFVNSFAEYFPEEKHNLESYEKTIRMIMDEFDLFHLRPSTGVCDVTSADFLMAANDFITKYVDDDKLRSLLAVVNTLYAGEKSISPAFLHAAITMIFLRGACRVAGGYSNFAEALADFIKSKGGEIIVNEAISKILTHGHRVTGVITSSGKTLNADYLVSSIPLSTMIGMMDNESLLSHAYKTAVEEKSPSLSAFIVNIKLKKDSLKFSNSVSFYLDSYDSVWKAYDGSGVKKFMYMTPPVIDQGEYAETLNVILPMKWSVVAKWENTTVGNRGQEYLDFKEALYKEIIEKLSTVIPNIEDVIEDADTSSPLTIRDYTGVIQGAMCGDRKDCSDPLAFMPVATRIPNLFVTGQNVHLHGFCGVTLTAIQTVEAMLGRGYIVNKINSGV